jgi:hypothetical protein
MYRPCPVQGPGRIWRHYYLTTVMAVPGPATRSAAHPPPSLRLSDRRRNDLVVMRWLSYDRHQAAPANDRRPSSAAEQLRTEEQSEALAISGTRTRSLISFGSSATFRRRKPRAAERTYCAASLIGQMRVRPYTRPSRKSAPLVEFTAQEFSADRGSQPWYRRPSSGQFATYLRSPSYRPSSVGPGGTHLV